MCLSICNSLQLACKFIQAGVQCVVFSLEEVKDQNAPLLFGEFYRNLTQKKSVIKAFLDAVRWARTKGDFTMYGLLHNGTKVMYSLPFVMPVKQSGVVRVVCENTEATEIERVIREHGKTSYSARLPEGSTILGTLPDGNVHRMTAEEAAWYFLLTYRIKYQRKLRSADLPEKSTLDGAVNAITHLFENADWSPHRLVHVMHLYNTSSDVKLNDVVKDVVKFWSQQSHASLVHA